MVFAFDSFINRYKRTSTTVLRLKNKHSFFFFFFFFFFFLWGGGGGGGGGKGVKYNSYNILTRPLH